MSTMPMPSIPPKAGADDTYTQRQIRVTQWAKWREQLDYLVTGPRPCIKIMRERLH